MFGCSVPSVYSLPQYYMYVWLEDEGICFTPDSFLFSELHNIRSVNITNHGAGFVASDLLAVLLVYKGTTTEQVCDDMNSRFKIYHKG